MPTITVKIFATLQLQLGLRELTYDEPTAPTVADLIEWMQRWADQNGKEVNVREHLLEPSGSTPNAGWKIRPGTMLLVDGRNVLHAQGLQTRLEGASMTLSVFPPAGGG